ncbi:MAG: hypothetical protein QNI84_06495 [Henriciella sp.]|nr:hypothetical protein [Henriciella sp.]
MSRISRIWLGLIVLLASCASSQPVKGEPRRAVLAPHHMISVEVGDIDDALIDFMSPGSDALILLPNRLDKTKLDYSLDSLKEIDSWLAAVHTINELQAGEGSAGEYLMMDGRGDNTVTFAGLYLGEVIRANSDLDWKWERFDLFLQANPYFAEHYGRAPGLDTFVLVGPQGVTTPINTALKRVVQGREESVHYIGSLLLNEIDMKKAVSGHNLMGLDRRGQY